MNYNEAKAKLNKYGQEHILNFWSRLSAKEQEQLLEQVSCTDFDIIQNSIINHGEKKTGKISPIMVKGIDEISHKHTRYAQLGTTALRDGKVAAVLLAGGMGTRLGSDNPKGMFDIGINKPVYIFQRLIENLMDSVNESGSYIHLFIMTSEKNNDATISFFTEKNFFGYPKEYVHFFIQEMAAATDYNGKVYMETQSRIA
ncbi:MAG: UTP--glucose-1-phosphate uridylyltransferase, partial [Butyrivibrio sp.]